MYDFLMKPLLTALVLFLVLTTPALALEGSPAGGLKERLQAKKAELEERQQAFLIKREEKIASVTAKKAELKDKKKEVVLSRVSDNLNKINKNFTDHLSKFLDKAAIILTKLEERVAKKATAGKDTTEAIAAIEEARFSLQTASDAVTKQAAKDYTISTATDETARTQANLQREQLRKDLGVVKDLANKAKKSVANAIRVSSQTLGGKDATKSAEVTP